MKVPALTLASALAIIGAASALDRKFDGLNYDTRGYDSDGCKYPNQILNEFKAFAPTTSNIRIYSTSCIAKVLDAASSAGLKVWIGLWSEVPTDKVHDAFESEFANLQKAVDANKVRNDNVLGIQVASEALYRYYIQGKKLPSDTTGYNLLIDHLTKVRTFLRGRNLLFPVTIADVMDAYNLFPDIYSKVDVVSVNQFSMWENKTAVDGVESLFGHWKAVESQARAQGKPIVLSETGWSTADDQGLVAEASPKALGIYTKDFLSFAETHQINYYYFAAIDLAIHADTIEKNFGVFDVNAKMKPVVAAVTVGAAPVATRLFHGDNVVKVDPTNWNALTVGPPAQALGQNLDHELWYYNAETKTFYSKSSNECLDAYGDANSALNAHVYRCNATNPNQQWSFTDNGHLMNLNGANQCMDVDPNQQNKVLMWWCYDGPNQLFKKRDVKDEPMQIQVLGGAYLNEWYSTVSWNPSVSSQFATNTMWFYDPISQQLKSKSANQCLDAYLAGAASYPVHTWACDATNANQKWQYNDVTGQWMHTGHLGLCLAASGDQGSGTGVTLQPCDKSQPNQAWTFKFAKQF